MRVSFTTKEGCPDLAIAFFWELVIETPTADVVSDLFIPELFFDYLFVRRGDVIIRSSSLESSTSLPQQSLRTLFGQQLHFDFTTPVRLFGARLELKFADSFWDGDMSGSQFLPSTWVSPHTKCLESFAGQVAAHVRKHRRVQSGAPMLDTDLSETASLGDFSDRHKRRLIHKTYGISRKEMLAIRNVHSFLGQQCVVGDDTPRLIDHVNDDVFYDQPHLNRTFKDRTGLAPLDYFEANSTLQENLMAVSYNARAGGVSTVST